jgi:hypothetical protein
LAKAIVLCFQIERFSGVHKRMRLLIKCLFDMFGYVPDAKSLLDYNIFSNNNEDLSFWDEIQTVINIVSHVKKTRSFNGVSYEDNLMTVAYTHDYFLGLFIENKGGLSGIVGFEIDLSDPDVCDFYFNTMIKNLLSLSFEDSSFFRKELSEEQARLVENFILMNREYFEKKLPIRCGDENVISLEVAIKYKKLYDSNKNISFPSWMTSYYHLYRMLHQCDVKKYLYETNV